MTVRDLKALEQVAGRAFAAVLLVRKATAKTSRNDSPYLAVELGDRTGTFSFTCFSDTPLFDFFKNLPESAVVRVEGKTDYYLNRFSPRITKADPLSAEQLAEPGVMENLVEVAPEDPAKLWEECLGYTAGIGHPELRATVQAVFDDVGEAFKAAPAAVAMHHAYRHGLLEHTVHMARAGRVLLPLYPEVDADRLERLEHVILSHQGELEYGAAVMAATPEAVFVSMVDNLDARMGMVQRALRQAAPGEEFSERLPGLNTALLTKKPAS